MRNRLTKQGAPANSVADRSLGSGMSRSKVAPLSKTPALRRSGKAVAKPEAKPLAKLAGNSAVKAKLPALALTTSRKALLVDGSDHAFRQLVHTLLAFLARHETVREGH